MTPWALERVRLFRTVRWAAIVGPYLLFGIAMPIVTRYQEALFRNIGGDLRVIAPEPTGPQAIAAYLQNATQLGLIVSVLVAAGSLAFDARPEWAMFLRTRTRSLREIVIPKVVTNGAVIATAFAVGLAAAWIVTRVLIEPVPVVAMLGGAACGAVYLAFMVSVVAFAAGITRSVLAVSGVTIAVLIVLPLIGQLGIAERWLPSALVGAPTELASGASITRFAPALASSVAVALVLVFLAVRALERREV
jgi:ABC-2 type transport system permease protein